jgi:hypothetical protein
MLHTTLTRLATAGALSLAALAGISGCSDDPSPVGSGYLPETVSFKSYVVGAGEVEIVSGQARLSNSTSQGSSTVLVGMAPDGTVAHGLLAITDPVRALEGTVPREVTAVAFRFRALPYRFGDLASRQTEFDVVAIDETALDTLQWSTGLVGKIEGGTVLGTYSGTLPDSSLVSVPLDLTAARQFLREYYTNDTTITTTAGNADTVITVRVRKTLALRARSGSRVVASLLGATFADIADSLRPGLVVTMGDSTVVARAGVSSWITDVPVETGANRIVAAGGEPIRTYLQVTPAGLPFGATIHQARLELHVDTAQSKTGTSGPTTYVVLYDADGSARTAFLLRSGGRALGGYRRAQDSTSFTDRFEVDALAPSITSAVRSRRAGGIAVAPFVLGLGRGSNNRVDQESSTVDRIVFHGFDAADSALRPKLTIIYSTQTDAL